MSIPLDRYYHYLENLCGDDTIIYHWYPHGSKKLENLTMLKDYTEKNTFFLNCLLPIIFHDQEPLCFGDHSEKEVDALHQNSFVNHPYWHLDHFKNIVKGMHAIRSVLGNVFTFYDKLILCHSELNSCELQKFEDSGFIGVYYWSHAIISRDWFRYAEHDTVLQPRTDYKYDFLIYNRAWAGTREYRLKFCEMLIDENLVSHCKTSFSQTDAGINYKEHKFSNRNFTLSNLNLENYFKKNTATSCYSADYDNVDYRECGIEVVLETLFDDRRNHLTEKTIRPIACNKPFILAAAPFSLQYLKQYGFKTFNGLIDESYDSITDPVQRLTSIVKELKRIASLPQDAKEDLWKELNKVSEYNQKLFFSDSWQDMIVDEFKTNLSHAINIAKNHQTGKYYRELYSHPDISTVTDPVSIENKKIIDQWLTTNGHHY